MKAGGGGFHPSWPRRAADEPHAVGGEASRSELLLGDIRHPRQEGGRLIHAQHCAGAVFGGAGAVGPREAARLLKSRRPLCPVHSMQGEAIDVHCGGRG
jgi:hypothetical protein